MTQSSADDVLGLDIRVFRLDPAVNVGHRENASEKDDDGHFISYMSGPISREVACHVKLSRTLEPQEAANLLRKLADRIELHGAQLLTLRPDQLGHFDAKGEPVEDEVG